MMTRLEKWWSQVNTDGDCWIWTGRKNERGYGYFRLAGERLAHRVSYTIFYGKITNGLLVCHRCDVPSCVRPAHLFLGTHRDNALDMLAKDRCGRAKVSAVQTAEIRRRYAAGERTIDLAREFGLKPATITNKCRGRKDRYPIPAVIP